MNALLSAGSDFNPHHLINSLIIFGVLIVAVLVLFCIMSMRARSSSEGDAGEVRSANTPQPAPTPAPAMPSFGTDSEIIAAIAAAIMAAEAESGKKFTVVSFRRK